MRTLSRLGGWLRYHTLDSRGSDAGFPDEVLVRGSQIVFAELKAGPTRLARYQPTVEQKRWLGALRGAGADARLWTPDDLEEIADLLLPAGVSVHRSNRRSTAPTGGT